MNRIHPDGYTPPPEPTPDPDGFQLVPTHVHKITGDEWTIHATPQVFEVITKDQVFANRTDLSESWLGSLADFVSEFIEIPPTEFVIIS